MGRVLLWVFVGLVGGILLLAGCGGRGGLVSEMARRMTPYAAPVKSAIPTRAGEATQTAGAQGAGARKGVNATASVQYGWDEDVPTNVELAHAALTRAGFRFRVVIVSESSVGIEGEIFRDLNRRRLRATTGPDEGIDTAAVSCHPDCVFVRADAVNEISVESWQNVLRHEQRHMVQARNNPQMAGEFRPTAGGMFTSYAAFLEACADEGIYVAENIYHASERMPELRAALGAERQAQVGQACGGFRDAYESVVREYEVKEGEGAFVELFPPYR